VTPSGRLGDQHLEEMARFRRDPSLRSAHPRSEVSGRRAKAKSSASLVRIPWRGSRPSVGGGQSVCLKKAFFDIRTPIWIEQNWRNVRSVAQSCKRRVACFPRRKRPSDAVADFFGVGNPLSKHVAIAAAGPDHAEEHLIVVLLPAPFVAKKCGDAVACTQRFRL